MSERTAHTIWRESGSRQSFAEWEPTPEERAQISRDYACRCACHRRKLCEKHQREADLAGLLGDKQPSKYAPGAVVLDGAFGGWEGER